MKTVLFIIAHDGFQPVEYAIPKKMLEAAGHKVITASDAEGSAVSSHTGEKVKVDLILDKVNVPDYDGVFFIGGPGAEEYLENEKAYRIAREVAKSGRPFGAICHSPRILAHAGGLVGRKATGWNEDEELPAILSTAGAEYVAQSVVVDGELITARDPAAAEEFGRKILEKLL